MKALTLFILLAHTLLQVKGADGAYATSKIPAALLVNANAVKRFEDIRFEVMSIEKAKYRYKVAFTILNEKGDKFAQCLEHYDQLQSIESIDGTLYDESGKKIKSLKKSDIQDRSGSDGNNLSDDNRIKLHNFYCKTYPYTVEYEVDIRFNSTLFYPGFIPQDGENLSVEYSRMTVVLPEGIDFRHKAFNITDQPAVTTQKSGKECSWEVKLLPAIRDEYASPSWYELTPVVCMGPVQFAVQGYQGNMATWKDFGKFVHALKAGRDELPDAIRQKVHQLTDGMADPKEKVDSLYAFLQKNSRYVSVQLGLGGWQPFDAKYVAGNRYGDCKALVNYMYALLKEAGIKSYYTLVKAGESNPFFISDFPSSQFNHVILSVPLQRDTLWLECTSQTLPPGYLSGFTCSRYALMIDESGGTLVRTPTYGIKDNLQVRTIKAQVKADGQLVTTVVTLYKARQEDDVHALINTYAKDKVLEYLKGEIDLPYYDVVSFSYIEAPSALPSITESLQLTASNYAQVTGRRLFVCPNILSKTRLKLLPAEDRLFDIDFNYPYTDIDSIEISIPAGYQPEAIPHDLQLESRFGKYSATVKVVDDRIIYYRSMQHFNGRFAAKTYAELVTFSNEIYKADRSSVVFVKKE